MPAKLVRILIAGVLVTALGGTAAACGWESPLTPQTTTVPVPSTVPVPTPVPDEPTPVPVPETPEPTEEPEPVPTRAGVTDTPWGAIVDQVPGDWPVHPGAEPVEPEDGPVSGAWLVPDPPGAVAGWYRDTLGDLAFTNLELSSPLEDGTQVLDIRTDLPECRIQVTFRPAGESTMVTVLYGAGCAGGDG